MTYQHLIDAFIAKGGEVTKCETGKSAIDAEYRWCDKSRSLVDISGDWSWKAQNKRSFLPHARRGKGDHSSRPDVIAANARRERLKVICNDYSTADLAKMFGVDPKVIRDDLRRVGIKPARVQVWGYKKNPETVARQAIVRAAMREHPTFGATNLCKKLAEAGHDMTRDSVQYDVRAIRGEV